MKVHCLFEQSGTFKKFEKYDEINKKENIKTVREFLIDILSNKTRKKKFKIRYGAGYYTFYVEDFEFIKDCSGTGLVIGNILDHEIEIL